MLNSLIGFVCGILVALLGAVMVRNILVPRRLLKLFSDIPKTMRFDLATPHSMRNMVALAEPPLAPWFDETKARPMLDALRDRLPELRPTKPPIWQRPGISSRPAIVHPTAPPPKGSKLPGEFEPLDAVLLTWPWHYPSRWKPHIEFAKAIADAGVRVLLMSDERQDVQELYRHLTKAGLSPETVEILEAPIDDVWIRDYGPTFVQGPDGQAVLVANPYAPAEHPYRKGDNCAALAIGAALELPVYRLPLLIEGGNLVSDGRGLMITSTATLDRNPEVSRADVAAIFQHYFGSDRTEFIEALPAEVTGHADMTIRFVDEATVVIASAPAGHRWSRYFDDVASQIAQIQRSSGEPYTVHRLPIAVSKSYPTAFWSYVNCLQVNGTTIVPIFGEPTDDIALEFFRSLGKGSVVGINFSDFLVGSVHCQSKEIFRGALGAPGRIEESKP
jgi:agmatine deiminase